MWSCTQCSCCSQATFFFHDMTICTNMIPLFQTFPSYSHSRSTVLSHRKSMFNKCNSYILFPHIYYQRIAIDLMSSPEGTIDAKWVPSKISQAYFILNSIRSTLLCQHNSLCQNKEMQRVVRSFSSSVFVLLSKHGIPDSSSVVTLTLCQCYKTTPHLCLLIQEAVGRPSACLSPPAFYIWWFICLAILLKTFILHFNNPTHSKVWAHAPWILPAAT